MSVKRSKPPTADQQGTGLIGTLFGTTAFLLFLLFSVQVLVGLYTTTLVTAAAADAATRLAHASDPTDATMQAELTQEARRRLGSFGATRMEFDWSATTNDAVTLHIDARKMTLLPAAFGGQLGNRIQRTYRARVERVR